MNNASQSKEVTRAVLSDLIVEHPLPRIRTGVKAGLEVREDTILWTIKFRCGNVKRS
jgi:hypothetical protein